MAIRSLRLTVSAAALAFVGLALSAGTASARDEGMWTFDNFPIAEVNAKYGTNIDQAWLDRVRLASVRIQGCSASFVSPEGLILTNHHCVVSCVQELSTAENDYVTEGWLTASREEEVQCPGQTAEVLTEIVDVTDRMLASGEGAEGAAFASARNAEANAIEQEACAGDAKLTCQVISFYRGGQYALYKFRKYDDVRLVFAPELQAAFFGGDPDNFNFPRYALDSAFLRVYEDGKPAETPNYLAWNPAAPKKGDVTFVSGNPGSTSRLLTLAQMATLRDQQIPVSQLMRSELRGRLLEFSSQDEESRRIALDPLFGVENSFKAFYGQQQALTDPAFMAEIEAAENELRQRVEADPALKQRIGDPWADLEQVQSAARDLYLPYRQLEAAAGQGSTLFSYARAIVRAAKQRASGGEPSTTLADRLAAERVIDLPIEELYLTFWLSKTREYLTVDDPRVKALLGKESPEALAQRLVEGTNLADPAFRVAALNMSLEDLASSGDPLLELVARTDSDAQSIAAEWSARVSAPTARAAEKVAEARFAVYGDDLYPDATFSLRLSYGAVEGWTYRGVKVEPFTYMGGLYERATGSPPFNLALSFAAAEDEIDKSTVYDFTTTNDIIGGNSGSPVINAEGEVIGAAFDGNIHSLGGAFGYDGDLNRTVVVSTSAITEALRNVYDQPRLLEELGVE